MLLLAGVAVAQGPPGVAPPATPADTRWAPPPPLPSTTAQPYKPLRAADAPPGRPTAPVATRPVLTLQKPAGADAPAPPPADPAKAADPKADRNPPKAAQTTAGELNKDIITRFDREADVLKRITDELLNDELTRIQKAPAQKDDEPRKPPEASYFKPPTVESLVGPEVRYQPRTTAAPPGQIVLEPGYVVHRRLYFEDLNSERHGWEVGIAQPAISTLLFFKDTVLWPAKLASFRGEWYDTSAGKCPPGSPVPYKLYPEQVDAFGILVGTGTIVGGVGIISGL